MKKSTKITASVAAVLTASVLGAYAFAQGGPGSHMRMGMHMGMGDGMMGSEHGPGMRRFGDPAARLASVKSEIGIKPEQSDAWDAYAKVVGEAAAEQRNRRGTIDRDAMRNMQPSDRQLHFGAMQKQREATFTKVNAAAQALLAQLDDAQKERANQTLPGATSAGTGPDPHHGTMGGAGMGPGFHR